MAIDLRQTFSDLRGFSPRNLKYMRACAAAWRDRQIVQRVIARMKILPPLLSIPLVLSIGFRVELRVHQLRCSTRFDAHRQGLDVDVVALVRTA